MSSSLVGKNSLLVYAATLVALLLLWLIYFSPVWWVSLTAPNYPPEAFPDGVRIHFHMNGVFNGCELVEKAEIREEEALDCVHEMDTINHYVGMYPIAAGGVIERAFSPFLVSMLGIMLIGFAIPKPKIRMAVMAISFVCLGSWMYLYYYGEDGLRYQNEGYLTAMVTALDQDTGTEKEKEMLSPGEALIARLRKEMGMEEPPREEKVEIDESMTEKEQSLYNLKVTFNKDQERRPSTERQEWNGSGSQLLSWHYEKSLGRYFNVPEKIKPMVKNMSNASHIVFWGLFGAMALLVWGARKNSGILYWLLILVPLALPVFFIIDYSAWLWWYGHSLNEMGAFTVKPFMPTVFGQGKVAQFATHSYPHIGFGMMLGLSAILGVAALTRRKD